MPSHGERLWMMVRMRDPLLHAAVTAVEQTTTPQAGRQTPDNILRNLAFQMQRTAGFQNFIEPTQNWYAAVRAGINADGDENRWGLNDAALLLQHDLIGQQQQQMAINNGMINGAMALGNWVGNGGIQAAVNAGIANLNGLMNLFGGAPAAAPAPVPPGALDIPPMPPGVA